VFCNQKCASRKRGEETKTPQNGDATRRSTASSATAQQKEEARAFWSRASEWGPSVNHPMTKEVAEFIQATRLVQEAGSAKRNKPR
jgi:hypothetical protein